MVFTEGWPLYRPDERLTRVLDGRVPTGDPLGADPRTGGFASRARRSADGQITSNEACDRLRTMLAYIDHDVEFRQLLQRANRANVSFYPIDARGLVVFDTPIELGRAAVGGSRRGCAMRHDDLADDGRADRRRGGAQYQRRVGRDAEDLRRRRLVLPAELLLDQPEARRPVPPHPRRGEARRTLEVRARPGYLAPTEAEARAAGGVDRRAPAPQERRRRRP